MLKRLFQKRHYYGEVDCKFSNGYSKYHRNVFHRGNTAVHIIDTLAFAIAFGNKVAKTKPLR